MSSILLDAVIIVLLFSGFMSFVNESGLYSQQPMPDSGMSVQLEDAEKTAEAFQEASDNPLTAGLNALILGGKVVFGAFAGLFSMGFLLEAYGIDGGLAGWMLSPLAIIFVFWAVAYWTGRTA